MKQIFILILLLSFFSQLILARNIEFAGRTWYVQDGHYGPGPNYFSDNTDNVWLDGSNRLHLKLRESGGTWYCPSIRTVEPTGFGMHRFYVTGTLTNLDPNIIFSPFVYFDTSHEIDIEFCRWGNTTPGIDNAQFVVQPHGNSGNLHTYKSSQNSLDTTHYFDWGKTNVRFKSFYGHHLEEQSSGDIIQKWNYDGNDNPDQSYDLNIHIIIWLLNGDAPIDGQELEMIVEDVDYPCYEAPTPDATDGVSNFVKIVWNFVDSADGYEVWRSLDRVPTHATKIAENISTNFYEDNTASNSINYFYWIVGTNDFGKSQFGDYDLGWFGEGTHVSTVDFFFDGFSRKNNTDLPVNKWKNSGWSSGDDSCFISNNSAYIFPGNGNYNWKVIRPMDTEDEDCTLNVSTGQGVSVSINLDSINVSTSRNGNDGTLNISILDSPITDNPYSMSATGLLLYADYELNDDELTFNLYKKNTANSVGTSLNSTTRSFVPGAEISLTFDKDNAKVIYNNETLYNGSHGIDTSSKSENFTGFFVQNIDAARANYFIDSAKILSFGNSYSESLIDDFELSYLNNSKWFTSSGTVEIRNNNNSCKLTPDDYNWAYANLGMKVDAYNPLKVDPNNLPLYLNVKLSDINIDTLASGPEIIFKTEFYPERTHSTSWEYNGTNLSVSTDIYVDGGSTTLTVTAQLFTKAETTVTLFSDSNITYDENAEFQFVIGTANFSVKYNGNLIGQSAHNINFPTTYKNGIFPMFIAQNNDSGRGSVFLDDAKVSLVPEPILFIYCYLLIIIYYFKNKKGGKL